MEKTSRAGGQRGGGPVSFYEPGGTSLPPPMAQRGVSAGSMEERGGGGRPAGQPRQTARRQAAGQARTPSGHQWGEPRQPVRQQSGRPGQTAVHQWGEPRQTVRRQSGGSGQPVRQQQSARQQPGGSRQSVRQQSGRPGPSGYESRQARRSGGEAGQAGSPARQTARQVSTEYRAAAPAKKKSGAGANFLVQGSILAAAGIIVRLIGMVYRIPLAKKIGDNGNGYYNAAYSIYSILLIMSSYSLPTAVSKMVSAKLAQREYRNSVRIFRAAMFYATAAGMAGFCALWFGADYFANTVIKMPFSSYALKALAPTIWIMAYLGVLRGYFQGYSTMIPTAVSQIFEQVINAVVSILAASLLFDMGVKSNLVYGSTEYSYAFGAAGGAIGTGAGALTAFLLFVMLAFAYRPVMKRQARKDQGGNTESYGSISRALCFTIVPIIVSSAIYNVSNVVDNSLFGHVMEALGESAMTASHWGVYMGRYHLLFNIPVAIANSLSSSLIPSLSRAVAERNRRQVLARIASAIRFSMIIAIPSAVGLTVLAEPISNLLFSGMDNTMLIRMMYLGSSAVVFFSLSTVTNAVLQGINRMRVPIINSAVSLAIHVGALYIMLAVFHLGIYSVVYANILFAALVCLFNAVSIARAMRYRQEILKTFLIPLLASAAMGGAAWGIYDLCAKVIGSSISTAAAILAAAAVYFVLLILLRGVDEKELKSMPGGTRLFRVARKLRLL